MSSRKRELQTAEIYRFVEIGGIGMGGRPAAKFVRLAVRPFYAIKVGSPNSRKLI
jgi:hypothetical protein